MHLHSSYEPGRAFVEDLRALQREGRLSRFAELEWDIVKPQLRRIGELDTLMRELLKLKREQVYAGLIIGGDFNFEPDSPEYEEALLLRLSDTYTAAAREGELYTADPVRNGVIGLEDPSLPKPLAKQVAKESPDAREAVISAYQTEIPRPRRIDFIFVDAFLPDHCLTQELFGLATNAEGLPASDHFGILNTYTRRSGPCPS